MRKCLLYFALILLGCSSNGDGGFDGSGPDISPVAHVPEIASFELSPSTVKYMEGDGTSVVTAEISFRDAGLDIQSLWVQMPDGTSMQFSESFTTETGTFTESLAMPADKIGAFPVEVWLVDEAGDRSLDHTAWYSVSDWSSRAIGLPQVLNDVIWDGAVFVAVGDGGSVMTSADGLDWIARASGVEADLHAVAAYGSDIFAVGHNVLLRSTDHGETWALKNDPAKAWLINGQFFVVSLSAVAINASQVVVSGMGVCCEPIIIISEDRGDNWRVISLPSVDDLVSLSDLAYRDGLFLMVGDTVFPGSPGWVFASSDGELWNAVFRFLDSGFRTIVDDGSRFTIAGNRGAAIASVDGLNWTEIPAPLDGVDFQSGAWSGTKLVLAGRSTCLPGTIVPGADGGIAADCTGTQPGLPIGVSSTDGGVTWEIFNIDAEFRSLGMAFGNGRFVSVGISEVGDGEGAIYTAD
jgi:photosystem II stability/assembly factor-like uncharacterized protein